MSESKREGTEVTRRPWTPPTLQSAGTLGEVLRGGGGKNSPTPADPGEIRKPKGNANEGVG
jgi:hypothetical protein